MVNSTNFSFNLVKKERIESYYTIDHSFSQQLSDILNKVKGRVDQQIAQSGDLDIDSYINFRINKRMKSIPNLDLFKEEIESRGLDVYFVVDCSYSMYYVRSQLRDLTATIYKALEKCPFINFHVFAYSGGFDGYLYIQEIENIEDCKYIVADRDQRGTPTDYALEYTHHEIKKLDSKKMVILFTDGLPEDQKSYNEMQKSIKRQVVKMNNDKITFFTIFFQNHEYNSHVDQNGLTGLKLTRDITNKMRDMFKEKMYVTDDFKDVRKIMTKQLIKSVEGLNQSA